MPDQTDPPAEVLALMADLAEARQAEAWDRWRAEWGAALEHNQLARCAAEVAHRAGFLAGLALMAYQVEAILTAAKEAGADQLQEQGSTGTGWPDYTRPSWTAPPAVVPAGEEAPTTET